MTIRTEIRVIITRDSDLHGSVERSRLSQIVITVIVFKHKLCYPVIAGNKHGGKQKYNFPQYYDVLSREESSLPLSIKEEIYSRRTTNFHSYFNLQFSLLFRSNCYFL